MAYQSKVIGLGLDGLLCNTELAKQEWGRKDPSFVFLGDNPFWASLTPYEDVHDFIERVAEHEVWILTERPLKFRGVTRGWLKRKCGIEVPVDHIICNTIKRYDCRLNGIEVLIDSDAEAIQNLERETVRPVVGYHVNRQAGESLRDLGDIHGTL